MSYSDDFAGDAAAAPLDPTILIGADPVFWGAILLALLAAALTGYLIGGRAGSKRGDAVGAVWEAINEAAKAAMKAETELLPARASDLQRVLRARLGKTLTFGGGLAGCVEALDQALDDEDAGADHDDPDHAPGEHAPDHAATPAAPAAGNVTIVSIHPAASAHAPHPAPKPGKRPASTRERNNAVRLAVAAFNDYWRLREAREGEMRAVMAELGHPDPRRPRLGHGGGHH